MDSRPVTQQHPVERVKDPVAAAYLRQVWDQIEHRYAPQHVILFGSRATGTARPDSDVDLILVSPCFERLRMADRTLDFLLEVQPAEFPISTDVLCYTPEEFKVMSAGIGMVAEAAREGIWIK